MQYKALSICCGALLGTSIAALQVDCGEMPLHLRRRQQMMEYVAKIQSIPDHPTQDILKAGKRRRLKEGREEIRVKVAEVNREILQPVINSEKVPAQPPWTLKPPVIETSLRNLSRSPDNLQMTKRTIEEHLQAHSAKLEVYTDGSRTDDGRASCSFYAPSMAYHKSYRLSDNTSIHAAEMMAIKAALEWATSVDHNALVIYSDSLGVLQAIEQRQSFTRPILLRDLLSAHEMYSRDRQAVATFVWIPAHLGIEGNEHADTLAKSALNRATVEMSLNLEYGKARTIYRDHFLRK